VTATLTPCSSGGSFDAASFVGGILLGVGVLVLAFLAYRCYVARHPDTPYQQF
jgi:hypothetical protein